VSETLKAYEFETKPNYLSCTFLCDGCSSLITLMSHSIDAVAAGEEACATSCSECAEFYRYHWTKEGVVVRWFGQTPSWKLEYYKRAASKAWESIESAKREIAKLEKEKDGA